MRSFIALLTLCVVLSAGTSRAQSSKVAVQVGALTLLPQVSADSSRPGTVSAWKDVLSTQLRASHQKDVLVTVSLEAGLYVDARLGGGEEGSTSEQGRLEVRVLVDGQPAKPGAVTFVSTSQYHMARLGDALQECTDANRDGTITASECLFTEDEFQEVQRTLSAHSFTFVVEDMDNGVHTLQVQARVSVSSHATQGESHVGAWLGQGTLTAEEVRVVKGRDNAAVPSL